METHFDAVMFPKQEMLTGEFSVRFPGKVNFLQYEKNTFTGREARLFVIELRGSHFSMKKQKNKH